MKKKFLFGMVFGLDDDLDKTNYSTGSWIWDWNYFRKTNRS